MTDYELRAQSFAMAPADELKQTLDRDDAVLLDVRTEDEIQVFGRFERHGRLYLHVPGSATSAEGLVQRSAELLPNKQAPVIVYCRSGRRAYTAKLALEEQGYQTVLNAGGYDDMLNMNL